MAPNKMSKSSKPSGDKDTPEDKPTGKVTGATPLTNSNWRRAPASKSAADHGSPSARHMVDDEDTEEDDGDSDGKQLVSQASYSFSMPSLKPELRLLYHPELSLPFFHVVVTWFASLAVLFSNTVTHCFPSTS